MELEVVLGGEHSCSQMELVFIREGEDSCTSIRKCNGKETSTDAEQTSCLVRVMFTSKFLGVCSFSRNFAKLCGMPDLLGECAR